MKNNPYAVSDITLCCQQCSNQFPAQRIHCIDASVWKEGRQLLDEQNFFRPVCPQCKARTELAYPSRYIDKELGISAALLPEFETADEEALSYINCYINQLTPGGMQHRIVTNFYAMAEQMRIRRHGLNDRAVQLMKPFIIGNLQSQGVEVWNGFFRKVIHPETAEQMEDTIYFSVQEDNAAVYSENVYQYDIYLTNGDILCQGINDTAYQICMNILAEKGLAEDDGQFHLYDLSWAIRLHNSLHDD